jgi:ribosomal protein L11 methyltransferase
VTGQTTARKMPISRKAALRATRCWRRWIVAGGHDLWMGRLASAGCVSWAFTERPQRTRVLLEAYVESQADARTLAKRWGGRVRAMNAREWIQTGPAPATRIGRRLEIIHEKTRSRSEPPPLRLHIPHGLAFGSGEHATTCLLLRELTRRSDLNRLAVLDLGTGSGVLALTARLLGARKIVATDFDSEAIRTARQNETLNFPAPLIHWRRADVRKLRATIRYDLVLANLFSGILCEAAPQIAACVSPGGRLWLSGILDSQQKEVIAAYRGEGLCLRRAFRRGKWVMLQWATLDQESVVGEKKTIQTK